ncbi:MAG: hypothetical protein JWR01_5 [Subtercola sp.]|nr:hypothetical protein [Subtercola sp.]
MPRRIPLPPQLANRPFSVSAAHALGLREERLYGVDLVRPFPGVRVVDGPFGSVEALAWAYAQRMPPTHFFSHTTAARLWHLPLNRPFSASEPVHVSSLERDRIRCRGTVGHQPRDGKIRVVRLGRVRTSDAVSTWLQLASILSVDALVAVGDALVRLGVESPKETELRLLIIRSGMPEPAVNVPIHGTRSAFVPRVDLVYSKWKVLVEYDGEQHRTDSRRYARDRKRAVDLRDAGWTLITVLKDGLEGVGKTNSLDEVRRALLRAGWPGSGGVVHAAGGL